MCILADAFVYFVLLLFSQVTISTCLRVKTGRKGFIFLCNVFQPLSMQTFYTIFKYILKCKSWCFTFDMACILKQKTFLF